MEQVKTRGRKPLPAGTVRVWQRSVNRGGRRMIERRAMIYLADGSRQPLAVFNWRSAGREIPEGWVIGHIDGNSLNDDLANLCLIRRGDVILEAVIEQPKREKWRRTRLRAGLRLRHHVARSVITSQVLTNPAWYPVDLTRRLIVLDSHRWARQLAGRYPVQVLANGHQIPRGDVVFIRGTDLTSRGYDGFRRVAPEDYFAAIKTTQATAAEGVLFDIPLSSPTLT